MTQKDTKQFDAEVGKVLHLMINSLYTNKDIFLRELISNASDACDKLRYAKLENTSIIDEELKINIKLTKDSIIITDNGIGMDKQDLIANLGTIARSGTQSFLENMEQPSDKLELIGQFGVGFYSAFLVADKVKVMSTKAIDDGKTYIWESEGKGEYSVYESETAAPVGTSVHLHIKAKEVGFLEKHKLQHIISTYSDHISFPISLTDSDDKTEIINQSSAIWSRPKSEITQEQYNEFYHHIAHMPGDPWLTLHNKAEGTLEYTSLLYIPSQKPFDLFHPDRISRVKLYVKKVFITDNSIELMPPYLRFLRGIIDSSDLPLNISREALQHNSTINKIKNSIINKLIAELNKKAKNKPEEFKVFWNNFGPVMKEGLCEGALPEKENLLNLCRFITTKSGDNFISLAEYIENMRENQKNIFYITGETIEDLRKSPQLEGFTKRDIEVILLSDNVDDFWVNVVHKYKEVELKSVMSSDIELNNIKDIQETNAGEPKQEKQDHKDLINYFKEVLADTVKDVKSTSKLVDFPASLAISDGSMNIRMEKFLIEQNQMSNRTAKILEINPDHPIISKISKEITDQKTNDNTRDLVNIIYNQACLIVGEPIKDPYQYSKLVNNILTKLAS